jgi:hypothetical protein
VVWTEPGTSVVYASIVSLNWTLVASPPVALIVTVQVIVSPGLTSPSPFRSPVSASVFVAVTTAAPWTVGASCRSWSPHERSSVHDATLVESGRHWAALRWRDGA